MPSSSTFSTLLQSKLQRMRAGDREARDELLHAVGDRLEKLARRMLRGFPRLQRWTETNDVLQNSMLRLLRALETVQPESTRDFFNLAAVQIRRELLDLTRQFTGPHGIAKNHGSGEFADQAPALADDGQLEAWCEFHQEVEKLPTEEREVFSLIFYHGWEQQAVAELLEVNVRTVRRWWQAASVRVHARCKDLNFE